MGPDENGSRFKPGAIFALGPDGEKYEPVVFTSFLNMNISTREKKMEIIDTTAPEGYEVAETTLAKNTVMALLDDLGNPACTEYPKLDETGDGLVVIPDIIGMADKIVEKLIAMGWRPTRAMKEDPHA